MPIIAETMTRGKSSSVIHQGMVQEGEHRGMVAESGMGTIS